MQQPQELFFVVLRNGQKQKSFLNQISFSPTFRQIYCPLQNKWLVNPSSHNLLLYLFILINYLFITNFLQKIQLELFFKYFPLRGLINYYIRNKKKSLENIDSIVELFIDLSYLCSTEKEIRQIRRIIKKENKKQKRRYG